MDTITIIVDCLAAGSALAAGDVLEVGNDISADDARVLVAHGRAVAGGTKKKRGKKSVEPQPDPDPNPAPEPSPAP